MPRGHENLKLEWENGWPAVFLFNFKFSWGSFVADSPRAATSPFHVIVILIRRRLGPSWQRPPWPPSVGRMAPRVPERVEAVKRLREVAARLGVAGGRLWERGRTIILARCIRPCRPSPPPPGYRASCMLRPTCVPFKYYNNQSRQGFNMATESKRYMGEAFRVDVEALT